MQNKARGRPREYDREAVLGRAVDVFSRKGFDATSLDDLAAAMKMNRPSIYNAFGDKESVYLTALGHFTDRLKVAVGELVIAEPDLRKALTRAYFSALDVYFASEPARGCFVFCTAPVEALTHPAIRRHMNEVLGELDRVFEAKFRQAQAAGAYPRERDAKLAARLAQSVLHSLAIRARAGESKASLRRLARFAVAQLCDVPLRTS